MKCLWYCLIMVHDIMLIWHYATQCSIAKPFLNIQESVDDLGMCTSKPSVIPWLQLQNFSLLAWYCWVRWFSYCICKYWLQEGLMKYRPVYPLLMYLGHMSSVSYIQEQEKYHLTSSLTFTVLSVPPFCRIDYFFHRLLVILRVFLTCACQTPVLMSRTLGN